MIACLENNKKYIGKSIDIKSRWGRHRWDLKNGSSCNPHLQSAWNLYGEDKFVFKVIEICLEEILSEKEDYYIDHYETLKPEFGYNILTTKILDRKIEERNAPRETTKDHRKNCKPVVSIYTETGDIQEHNNALEMSAYLNLNHSKALECLSTWAGLEAKMKRYTLNGYILIYKDNYTPEENYLERLNNIKRENRLQADAKRVKEKIVVERQPYRPIGKGIKAIKIEDESVTQHISVKGMCRDLNLVHTLVRKCLSEKFTNTQHRGYRFELL